MQHAELIQKSTIWDFCNDSSEPQVFIKTSNVKPHTLYWLLLLLRCYSRYSVGNYHKQNKFSRHGDNSDTPSLPMLHRRQIHTIKVILGSWTSGRVHLQQSTKLHDINYHCNITSMLKCVKKEDRKFKKVFKGSSDHTKNISLKHRTWILTKLLSFRSSTNQENYTAYK